MATIRTSNADPGAAVRRVHELAVELGRIPTASEVRRALAQSGLAAGDVVDSTPGSSSRSVVGPPAEAFDAAARSPGPGADENPALSTAAGPPADQPAPAPSTLEDAWWAGVLDLGSGATSADVGPNDAVRSVIDDLAGDWERAGRRLGAETLARTMERRRLDAGQRAAVVAHLLERGIAPTLDDAELPDVTHTTRSLDASSDYIGTYLHTVGRRRLLTAEEEVRLGRLVRRGQVAEEELADISTPRTRRETRQLETEAARGREARSRFVEANLRLAVSLAYKRLATADGVELLDLIQFGNLGLIRAVEKFDPELGYKFSTYATWWVRQAMDRGIADTGRLVRIPVHLVEKLNKVRAATRRLGYSGHVVTAEAVAAITDLDRADVEYLWEIDRPVVRLDAPVGADSDATLADILMIGHMGPGPEALACRGEAHESIRRMLSQNCPDARSARIIAMRFGIETDQPMTLDEIGKEFGVTRERIRQLEKKAIELLRPALSPQHFRDLIEAIS